MISNLNSKLLLIVIILLKKIWTLINHFFDVFGPILVGYSGLEKLTSFFYSKDKSYFNEEYIFSGLFNWEKKVLDKYLGNREKLLLYSAGSGRELFWLLENGFHVDAYECNLELTDFGNKLLKKKNINNKILYLPENIQPNLYNVSYDFAIIGWGGYSHIFKQSMRIDFLKQLRSLGIPVLLSFLGHSHSNNYIKKRQYCRIALNKVSLGLIPTYDASINFPIHFVPFVAFSHPSLKNEVRLAGFKIDYFNDEDYGHAVLIPIINK